MILVMVEMVVTESCSLELVEQLHLDMVEDEGDDEQTRLVVLKETDETVELDELHLEHEVKLG